MEVQEEMADKEEVVAEQGEVVEQEDLEGELYIFQDIPSLLAELSPTMVRLEVMERLGVTGVELGGTI